MELASFEGALLQLEQKARARSEIERQGRGLTSAWAQLDALLWRVKLMRLFGQNQHGPAGRLP